MGERSCILGIDPGQSGAVSFYFPSEPHLIAVEDMPLAGGEVEAANLANLIGDMRPAFAVIERVHSMPKQGVASSFKFGCSYGQARGVVAALRIPLHLVTPNVWKKHFRLSSDKEQSRSLALRLWPEQAAMFARKKHSDRAEAALLARYGAEVIAR